MIWSRKKHFCVLQTERDFFFFSWHTLLHCHMPFICVCWSNFWNLCHLSGVYEHLWLLRVAATNLGNALQEVPWVSVEKVQEQNQHIGCFVDLCFLNERHNLSLLTASFTWKKCNIAATIILWLILENKSIVIFKCFSSPFIFLHLSVCIISHPSESTADDSSVIPYWCTRECHFCLGKMHFSMCLV